MCDKIFQDKLVGVKDIRPGIEEALQHIRPSDSLVVWRLNQLGEFVIVLMKANYIERVV
ncbi:MULTISPECIES: recombinase family protein [Bacillus cereus group]|uniref:recombinase family protein n=1 Tax=Bacillus cereus group TaxID=86661 RepID=UPI0020D27303|nr:recombinase family protein [Bacillus thuringiensis]MCQ6335057.1 recombinase family protein [Bacillus cereus]